MAKMGNFSLSEMKKLQEQLNRIRQDNVQAFVDACAKELAARLLSKVIKRTPVGNYPRGTGKKGGTLRRGWTAQNSSSDGVHTNSAAQYADSLKINHFGNMVVIEIVNPVEYAPYVEYGHRTANHRGWVQGKFMLTISEDEIREIAPKVLESRIKKFMGECFK